MTGPDQTDMMHFWQQVPDGIKHLLDLISFTALLGTLVQMLPHVAAGLTIIWTAIRIYETQTVQRIIGRKGKK